MKNKLAIFFGVVLLILMITFVQPDILPNTSVIGAGAMNQQSITFYLFNEYILPFEIVTFILLAGMLGAMYIGERGEKE